MLLQKFMHKQEKKFDDQYFGYFLGYISSLAKVFVDGRGTDYPYIYSDLLGNKSEEILFEFRQAFGEEIIEEFYDDDHGFSAGSYWNFTPSIERCKNALPNLTVVSNQNIIWEMFILPNDIMVEISANNELLRFYKSEAIERRLSELLQESINAKFNLANLLD